MLRCAVTLLVFAHLATGTAWAAGGQDVVVVLDDSGSMADRMRSGRSVRKIDAAKVALLEVLSQVPDSARVGVLALNTLTDQGHWVIPLGPLDRGQIGQAVAQIRAEGGTPLGTAMKEAADALLAAREKQIYGDYRLLIVTDGEAQDSDLVEQYLPEILDRQITVDVIGVAMAQNHSLATRVDRYRRADDPDSLRSAIQAALAETPLQPQDLDDSSDFELLAGLPEEVAVAAIQALSETDNRPIGESGTPVAELPTGAPNTGPPGMLPPGSTLPAQPDASGDSNILQGLVFGIILVVMVLVSSAIRRSRSRRR